MCCKVPRLGCWHHSMARDRRELAQPCSYAATWGIGCKQHPWLRHASGPALFGMASCLLSSDHHTPRLGFNARVGWLQIFDQGPACPCHYKQALSSCRLVSMCVSIVLREGVRLASTIVSQHCRSFIPFTHIEQLPHQARQEVSVSSKGAYERQDHFIKKYLIKAHMQPLDTCLQCTAA